MGFACGQEHTAPSGCGGPPGAANAKFRFGAQLLRWRGRNGEAGTGLLVCRTDFFNYYKYS